MEIRSTTISNYDNSDVTGTSPLSLSAVSWSAIFAGASAAAALSLILFLLGTGLGFSAVSPWAHEGISGTTFSVTTIVWITITSLIASGFGGYIAGRLRTRWIATPADEVYFRDTAHGFLAWAVATLATATLLASVIGSVASGAAKTGAALAGGVASTAAVAATTAVANTDTAGSNTDKSLSYFLDSLFRKNLETTAPTTGPSAQIPNPQTNVAPPASVNNDLEGQNAAKAEIARIFINALANGSLPSADQAYAAQVLSQHTGISQQEAENRINATFTTVKTKLAEAETAARAAADKARKATAYGSLWLFISLLAGAFVASWLAIYGGRQRDL